MNTLYVMVGIPGAGKTHWAKQFIKNNPNVQYVSRDEIRMSLLDDNDEYFAQERKVFNRFVTRIVILLNDHQDVIADATHLSQASRAKLINNITNRGISLNDFVIEFIFINPTLEQCLRNNDVREGRAYVPKSQIRRMWHQLEPPSANEFKNCKGVMTINV